MGQEIVYCAGCARMLRTADFEKGQAVRFEGKVYCVACAPLPAKTPSRPHPSVLHDSSRHRSVRVEEFPKPRPLAWIAVAVGIAAVFVIAGILLSRSSWRRPEPMDSPLGPVPAPPTVRPKEPPRPDPREKAAALALERAREALRAAQQDLTPAVLLFEEACKAAEGTGYAAEAERERAQALTKNAELAQAALAQTMRESQAPLEREEYAAALEVLEKARARSTLPSVRQAIDARKEELRSALGRLRGEVRAQAVEARRAGSEREVALSLERAARWGDPAFVDELKKVLERVLPPPSPEVGTYFKSWRAALDQAARGDLAGALDSMKSAAGALTDPKTREEAAADLALFQGAQDVRKSAVEAFGRLQKGQRISLESLDEDASRRRVEGTLLRSGPGWIAVTGEAGAAPVFVETGDLTSAAVGALVQGRENEVALLGLLEGRSPDASAGLLPEKYSAWARERGAPQAPAHEREARRLFHEAFDSEREWPEQRRKGSSAALYRKLLAEYSDTAFVAGRRGQIVRRAEPPAELVFPPDDLRGHGGFRLMTPDKAPSYWHLAVAPASGLAQETYLEIDFEVGSEAPLKAWAYVGACCSESLSIGWQETDLTGSGPRGQPVQMDPGSSFEMMVKASIPKLPRNHVPGKTDPVNYGWISLPMPKVSPAGSKKARLLADRAGVAVKSILISSIRPAAPTDVEAREFEQVAPSTLLVGLVGWWKLDEHQGPSADSSGRGHEGTWMNGPTASSGEPSDRRKAGSTLLLSGAGQYVELAQPGTLPSGRSPRSLCGWGRTRSQDAGFRWIASFGLPNYQRAMFIGRNGKSLFGGAFADDLKIDGFWDDQWHHVALTYDGTTATLYGDGTERASGPKSWDLDPKYASIGRQVNFGTEFWNGAVDDVRIYDRALTAAEVRRLAEGR